MAEGLVCGEGEPVALRARYVFPVSSPPIPGGVVVLQAGQIVEVGTRGSAQVTDLGNVAILPGLVNAHTHLEFSRLDRPLGRPGIGFVDWIRLVIEYRCRARGALQEGIALGLAESRRCGTTALAEIAQPGWPVEQFASGNTVATVLLELIGPTDSRAAASIKLAQDHVASARPGCAWRVGLSPHAPYSVHPDLLAGAVSIAACHGIPLAMHLAESQEEIEWLESGGGPLGEFLSRLDGFEPAAFPPGRRVLDYLRILAQAPRALVVHGNYLRDKEIAFLAARADRMAVVYCPRTHAYFRHEDYPLKKLLAAGVNVALGTDSRATAPDLSLLAEMRFIARHNHAIDGPTILTLGTLAGARALGCEHQMGSLEPGKLASLAVIALPECDAPDPHELVLNHDGAVLATLHGTGKLAHLYTSDATGTA